MYVKFIVIQSICWKKTKCFRNFYFALMPHALKLSFSLNYKNGFISRAQIHTESSSIMYCIRIKRSNHPHPLAYQKSELTVSSSSSSLVLTCFCFNFLPLRENAILSSQVSPNKKASVLLHDFVEKPYLND